MGSYEAAYNAISFTHAFIARSVKEPQISHFFHVQRKKWSKAFTARNELYKRVGYALVVADAHHVLIDHSLQILIRSCTRTTHTNDHSNESVHGDTEGQRRCRALAYYKQYKERS
jgi:hypothetical protein